MMKISRDEVRVVSARYETVRNGLNLSLHLGSEFVNVPEFLTESFWEQAFSGKPNLYDKIVTDPSFSVSLGVTTDSFGKFVTGQLYIEGRYSVASLGVYFGKGYREREVQVAEAIFSLIYEKMRKT